jgi:hypothetical protein
MVIWGIVGISTILYSLISGSPNYGAILILIDLILQIGFLISGLMLVVEHEYGFYVGIPLVVLVTVLDLYTVNLIGLLIDVSVLIGILRDF